jgi:hypothetical protein
MTSAVLSNLAWARWASPDAEDTGLSYGWGV